MLKAIKFMFDALELNYRNPDTLYYDLRVHRVH